MSDAAAWQEVVTTGKPGAATVAMMVKLARQIVRTSSYPPPPQHSYWSDEAVVDFLGQMFDEKRGNAFVIACSVEAVDEKSFERLMYRTIQNHLKDQAKTTAVGRMRRRLASLLGKDDRFLDARHILAGAEGWTLPRHETSVWTGDHVDLFDSTLVPDDDGLTELNTAGKTSAHNVRVLTDYVFRVLDVALGALRAQLIARFVVTRYELDTAALLEAASDIDSAESSAETPAADHDLLIDEVADAVCARVTSPEEAATLAYWDDLATLADALGVPVDVAESRRDTFIESLRPFCDRTNEGAAGFQRAVETCRRALSGIGSSVPLVKEEG